MSRKKPNELNEVVSPAVNIANLTTVHTKLDALDAKLDAILDGIHSLRQLVHRMTVPVDVLSTAQTATRLGVSIGTVERITARAIFTDARAPDRRVSGAPRVYYADEVDVYRSEGERGVKRLREQLGRA